MKGRLFLVVGPSGVGKDTLLAGAAASDANLHWARRVITRPATPEGEPFEGVTVQAFSDRLMRGEFALHWEAHGLRYGVPFAELEAIEHGRAVLVNGSRGAISAALAAFPDLKVIRISAPSSVLADRLALRGRETREEIKARLDRASYDLQPNIIVIDVHNIGSPAEGIANLLQAIKA